MFNQITNSTSSKPEWLVGLVGGQPVLVPVGGGLAVPQSPENSVQGYGSGTMTAMLAQTPTAGAIWITDQGLEFIGRANAVAGGVYWAPRCGRQTLFRRSGSIATPIATLTGTVAGIMTLPATLSIPPNLLAAGLSKLYVEALFVRTGITATLNVNAKFGSANGNGDQNIVAQNNIAATAGLGIHVQGYITFGSTTVATSVVTAAPEGTNASVTDSAQALNVTNYINFGINSANVADGIQLIDYEVALIG